MAPNCSSRRWSFLAMKLYLSMRAHDQETDERSYGVPTLHKMSPRVQLQQTAAEKGSRGGGFYGVGNTRTVSCCQEGPPDQLWHTQTHTCSRGSAEPVQNGNKYYYPDFASIIPPNLVVAVHG